MHKINKFGLILILATLPTLASYADTQVEVKGFAPQSKECRGIEYQPFGLNLTMPSSQYDSAKINSAQGFTFHTPKRLPLNNEGVQGSCDYYLNSTGITVRGQRLTLDRLVINSTVKGKPKLSVCTNVTVTLSIITGSGSDCDVTLTQ